MPVGGGLGDSADDTYLERVRGTPAPATYGKLWTEWQFPPNADTPLYNMGRPYNARVTTKHISILFNLQHQHHMQNPCLDRLHSQEITFLIAALPAYAGQGFAETLQGVERICVLQGLPAALVHAVFGKFLDRCRHLPVQRAACSAVLQLSRALSETYWNTAGSVAARDIAAAMPPRPTPRFSHRGGEAEMLQQFRKILLEHFKSQIPGAILTLEPSTNLVRAQHHQLIAWCRAS